MTVEIIMDNERELQFNQMIVADYLTHGSVDEVFTAHRYDLPISYPGVHRILNRWGIVKSAGPNTRLAESLAFFTRLLEERIPLERLYKQMPPNFMTSMATLHRIYGHIKKQVKKELEQRSPLRYGTALIVSPQDDGYKILTGLDVSPPKLDLGKQYGSVSLPMGFSKKSKDHSGKGEEPTTSVLRVMQQEVFAQETVDQRFPYEIIPRNPNPMMYLDIADVRVAVYRINLPPKYSDISSFSSFKLQDFQYVDADALAGCSASDVHIRMGVIDIAQGFLHHMAGEISCKTPLPRYYESNLNRGLAALALDFVDV
ncbi:hypothetical protein A2V80_00525 [Candidatus Woesebacteria bacterium RBG_16_39_8b]|uniref:Uncharacterized protein n=1 Tax=Candidatus Woesebacteria bacterium RBG_16_39_8b TaxID=1802482 RepID=A0A1F7XEJ7_9BACT|nr:MAG: hypothetical protein A2V80_00525 [Candidatus Woesebacteria bacterium RBG_16_39_8b]